MKTVGIVGGLDFLGCDITLKFLSENYFVKVLDLPSTKKSSPVISTNLKNVETLRIFSIDLANPIQLSIFLKDCDFLIHCGRPFKLDVKSNEGSLYVPVITDSGCLLKVLSKTPAVSKIIFLSSVAVLNMNNSHPVSKSGERTNQHTDFKQGSRHNATYHSDKIISKTLEDFSNNRLEVVHVAPVVVANNMLINTRETTLAGLQYLFRNNIEHDTFFQKLAGKNLLETMVDANILPDKIYSCVKNFKENSKSQVRSHY